MPRLFRSFAAALALVLLLAGAAQAGPLGPRPVRPGPAAFFDLLLDWIDSLRTPPDSPRLSPVREEEGSIMDPDGRDGSALTRPWTT